MHGRTMTDSRMNGTNTDTAEWGKNLMGL